MGFAEDVMEILSYFERVNLTNSRYKKPKSVTRQESSGGGQKNVGPGRITMSSLVSPPKKEK